MRFGLVGFAAAVWVCGLPGSGAAQSFDRAVTFTMPVQLTLLSPDVDRVGLVCVIIPSQVLQYPDDLTRILTSTRAVSESWPFRDELPVVAGQAAGTLDVVHRLATEWFRDPIGKNADYTCSLVGYSKSLQRWDAFSETPTEPVFLLNPTPRIRGVFTW
jgi:hypothetical protein